jgi:uroporphyrinogen decarboxylase
MRQAGRYQKSYRAIREKVSFLELCKNPQLAAQVTVEAQESLDVDAAIIFSDILLIVEAFGMKLDFLKGDGPSISRINSAEDIQKLPDTDPAGPLSFVMDAIRQTRKFLKPNIPLIGFAGAPFTVASYMVEGGSSKDFSRAKDLMRREPAAWHLLLEKISRATALYLNAQVKTGAQTLQVFDSWAGQLTPDEYRTFVYPHSKKLFESLDKSVPTIHFGASTGPFLEDFSKAGGSVIGVDHRVSLKEAWGRIGNKSIQGNLDPQELFKDKSSMKAAAQNILKQAEGRPGHIFNLGHGILPETPEQNVVDLVKIVKEMSRR